MKGIEVLVGVDKKRGELVLLADDEVIASIKIIAIPLTVDVLNKILKDFTRDTGKTVPRSIVIDYEDAVRMNPDDN